MHYGCNVFFSEDTFSGNNQSFSGPTEQPLCNDRDEALRVMMTLAHDKDIMSDNNDIICHTDKRNVGEKTGLLADTRVLVQITVMSDKGQLHLDNEIRALYMTNTSFHR